MISDVMDPEEMVLHWSVHKLDPRLVFGVKCLTNESCTRIGNYFLKLQEEREISFKIRYYNSYIFVENAKLVDPMNEIIFRGHLNFRSLMLSFVESWGEKTRRQILIKFFQLDKVSVPKVKIFFEPCPSKIAHMANAVLPKVSQIYDIRDEGTETIVNYGRILIYEFNECIRAFDNTA
jgi:hypothetical protein